MWGSEKGSNKRIVEKFTLMIPFYLQRHKSIETPIGSGAL